MHLRLLTISLALIAAALFSGCGNDGTASKGSAKGQPGTFTGAGSTENVSQSYEFSQDGCSTGYHSFSGANADDVTKRLCTALQDHDLNLECAEGLRQEFFSRVCGGVFQRAQRSMQRPSEPSAPHCAGVRLIEI
jgi:hypothetical protein